MNRNSLLRISIMLCAGLILAGVIYYSPAFFVRPDKPIPAAQLNTGGSSVVYFIMNKWRKAYHEEKKIEVEYDAEGSTNGVTQMIEKKYSIGFTHAPMTEEQRKKAKEKGGEVIHIPVVITAVVPIYNLKDLKDKPPLRFNGDVLARIYLGKIEKWNDPALKELNEGVELPDEPIIVVHREDSSGTTFVFTEYLSEVSPLWKSEVGEAGTKVKWPTGVGIPRNYGVAGHVSRTEGAIGYVDVLHAYNGKIPYGAVQNKDKSAFIHAEAENVTAAAKSLGAELSEDLTFNLTNKSGKDAYPICGATWAVCYQTQPATSQKEVTDFLEWIIHAGQKYTKDLHYAPLPEEIVQRVDQKIKTIRSVQ